MNQAMADQERSEQINKHLEEWCRKLHLRIKSDDDQHVIELSAAHPTGLAQLYAGRPTRLSNLVREPRALSQCRIKARHLISATGTMENRYGVAPVYLALGTASWSGEAIAVVGSNVQEVSESKLSVESPTEVSRISTSRNAEAARKSERLWSRFMGDAKAPKIDEPVEVELESQVVPNDSDEAESASEQNAFNYESENTAAVVKGPVLLYPIELSVSDDDDILLTLDQTPQLWPFLEKALREAGEKVAIQESLLLVKQAHGFSPDAPLPTLTELCRATLPDFNIHNSITVGQYLHPLIRVYAELYQAQPHTLSSALVGAIAGDARSAIECLSNLPEFLYTDRDPNQEHGVGDLDPTQHNILDSVAAGANVLLDAPAGAEARSTVAAVLADAVSCGQTAAYLSGEKRKANSLYNYLKDQGLDEITLDLTRSQSWHHDARLQLARTIRRAANYQTCGVSPETQLMRDELTQVRTQLGGYMEQLHAKRAPWGVSAYDALQVLADLTSLKPGPRTRVRFDIDTLHRIASDGAEAAQRVLEEAETAGIFNETRASNPWHGVVVSSQDQVPAAIDGVKRIASDYLPKVREQIERAVRETGLVPPGSLDDWRNQLQMLDGIRQVMDVFRPEIFERSAADMVIATAPKRWRQERALNMKESSRRRLVKQAKGLVRPGRRVEDLHMELIKVQQQRQIWREFTDGGGWPMLPGGLAQMIESEKQLRAEITEVQPFFSTGYGNLSKAAIEDVTILMNALAADNRGAQKLPERVAILKRVRDLGLEALVEDMRERRVPSNLIKMELDLAWWASALAEILQLDDRLSRFTGGHLRQLSNRLRELDLQQVKSLPAQTLDEVWSRMREVVVRHHEEAAQVLNVLDDGTVELSALFKQFPWLSYICPIRIVPPVMMADMVRAGEYVDVVVLDGLDGTEIAELVPAVSRSRQLVVVGDSKRRQEGTVYTFSKLFPVLKLPQSRIRTNEWVAGFLSDHGFGQEVMPIALPRHNRCVDLHVVDGRGMPAPGVQAIESSTVEVDKVVQLVTEHALNNPEDSLAVVSLNERHRQRISEALLSAAASSPTLDSFINTPRPENFVVVSAENANGLRRDNVVLTLGFAKTPHGRVLHDFGAISGAEGATHLVDALSVVRNRLSVVASMEADELDRDRLRNQGSLMLLDLLECAKSQQQEDRFEDFTDIDSEEQPDRLLLDLAERLYSIGLTVIPNLGSEQGIKIPLAIGHPDYPGELLLAVLTDNADFVAEKSLRLRERHWVERLEDHGWEVTTVYSTAAFMDPQEQAKQILHRVLDVVEARQAAEADVVTEAEKEPEFPSALPEPEIYELAPEPEEAFPPAAGYDRPPLARGLPLSAYSDDQLDELLAWIRSDGVQRDQEGELNRLYEELQLAHPGQQSDAVLINVIRRNA